MRTIPTWAEMMSATSVPATSVPATSVPAKRDHDIFANEVTSELANTRRTAEEFQNETPQAPQAPDAPRKAVNWRYADGTPLGEVPTVRQGIVGTCAKCKETVPAVGLTYTNDGTVFGKFIAGAWYCAGCKPRMFGKPQGKARTAIPCTPTWAMAYPFRQSDTPK